MPCKRSAQKFLFEWWCLRIFLEIGVHRVDLILFIYLLLNLFDCKTSWMFLHNIFRCKIKLTDFQKFS